MFDRFTDRAKKVMALARGEAQRFNHEYIGTEHVLLGLVKEGSGIAANVLRNMGVDLPKVRLEVERVVKAGPSPVTMGELPFTPRMRKVFDLAVDEASNLGDDDIDTGHLLLALIREDDGIAATILIGLGVKLEDARKEIIEFAEKSKNPSRREVVGTCSACNGKIIKETLRRPSAPTELCIIGPGSETQMTEVTEYYCKNCGIMYKFPPKK